MDVVGFCFLDLASNYQPPQELADWLKAGPMPIYIGFGSLVKYPSKYFFIFIFLSSGDKNYLFSWGYLNNLFCALTIVLVENCLILCRYHCLLYLR